MARVRRYMSPDQMEIMSREHHEGRIIMIMSMVEVVVEGEEEEVEQMRYAKYDKK